MTQTGVQEGKIKWYNEIKQYGFITPASGGKDVFVHSSQLTISGLSTLVEGQKVTYELQEDRGKIIAVNIKIVN